MIHIRIMYSSPSFDSQWIPRVNETYQIKDNPIEMLYSAEKRRCLLVRKHSVHIRKIEETETFVGKHGIL